MAPETEPLTMEIDSTNCSLSLTRPTYEGLDYMRARPSKLHS